LVPGAREETPRHGDLGRVEVAVGNGNQDSQNAHYPGAMDDRRLEGIRATNQAFARYDQVEKRQEYHLAEKPEEDLFDEGFRIKTCDMADEARFPRQLGEALSESGFAVLEGHGVDPALYDECEERTLEFFTKTPLEDKLRFRARRHGSVNQGYFPIKETSDIHPDLVEGRVFCRRASDLDGDPAFRA